MAIPFKARRKTGVMSARFHMNNFIIISLTVAAVAALATLALTGIASDTSRKYARLYALETAGKFNLYLNKEFDIIKKIAASKELLDWFADEGNAEKKYKAYKKVATYSEVMNGKDFYFGIEDSLHVYAMSHDTALEKFAPFEKPLNPADPEDRWYFECRGKAVDYALSVDIGRHFRQKRLWLNYKVIDDKGVIRGIVSSGLDLKNSIETLFNKYEYDLVRNIAIDKEGVILLDSVFFSAEEKPPEHFFLDENPRGKIEEVIPELRSNHALKRYLKSIDGYFTSRADSETIIFTVGNYQYAMLTPLINWDWSIVSLFKRDALFSKRELLLLIVIIGFIFTVYAVASTIFAYTLMVSPLNSLTGSLTNGEDHIFGLYRNDEFGLLARTIQSAVIRVRTEKERTSSLFDPIPLCCEIWEGNNIIDCNKETMRLFDLERKEDYITRFPEFIPEYQPDGRLSFDEIPKLNADAYRKGKIHVEWLYQKADGTPIPVEVVMVHFKEGNRDLLCTYTEL
jgi:PAS domain-containing protein